MAKLSGFPEYLPEGRMVETRAIDILRTVFELHGFAPVQTRSLEPLADLSRKGEITKEVYAVRRLHADGGDRADFGLHFDLTVPFARYVLDNAGHLTFPFRRYQIQPAWRGERPQEGRYREFWQADVDIVGQETLGFHHDIEVVLVMLQACSELHDELGIPPVRLRLNNRKLIQGFYAGLGVADLLGAVQVVDKLGKIGRAGVEGLLAVQGIEPTAVTRILDFAEISADPVGVETRLRALGMGNAEIDEGLDELSRLFEAVDSRFPDTAVIDCSTARGLDYYTGSVFEIELRGQESLGTISAGGRYDSLAKEGKRTYPGVGISFGLTRVFAPLISQGKLVASRKVPSAVLVAVDSDQSRTVADDVADVLRGRGIPCEVSPHAQPYGKQIRLADRRGIPFVWFGAICGQAKDIRSGEQVDADANTWTPPGEDLVPRICVVDQR